MGRGVRFSRVKGGFWGVVMEAICMYSVVLGTKQYTNPVTLRLRRFYDSEQLVFSGNNPTSELTASLIALPPGQSPTRTGNDQMIMIIHEVVVIETNRSGTF